MGWESECIIFKSLQEFNDWKNEIESRDECLYICDEISNEKYKLMLIRHGDLATDYSVLVELS